MKRIVLIFSAVVIASAMIITSCSSGGGDQKSQSSTQEKTQAAPAKTAADNSVMLAKGEEIYKSKCIVCHQANGQGLPNAFPPLAGSDYLLKDKVRAVAQALNGSNMEITVNGLKFTAPMPPQVNNYEDAVAVINYVLNNFGNNGGYVTVDEVKHVVINPR